MAAFLPESIPGEKLLIKVWETLVDNGLGGLLTPWQIRREGRARTEVRAGEVRHLAQAERDAEAIRRGEISLNELSNRSASPSPAVAQDVPKSLERPYSAIASGVDGESTLQLIGFSQSDAAATALRRAINLRKIALLAEQEAERVCDEDVSDEPVDPDWFVRWRKHAEDISKEDLQIIWGRLLAEEIKRPGQFCFKTLDTLSQLSRPDAEKIKTLASFVIDGHRIIIGLEKGKTDIVDIIEQKLSVSDFRYLTELGVIFDFYEINPHFNDIPANTLLVCSNRGIKIECSDTNKKLSVANCPLSKVGSEILRLGIFEANNDYILEIAKVAKAQGFRVFVGDVVYKRNLDDGKTHAVLENAIII